MNNTILRGFLTTNPEVRIPDNEEKSPVAYFTLAVPDRTHRNAEGKYPADFIRIAAFNTYAQITDEYLTKGSEIIVTGKIHSYKYEKDNQTCYGTEVIANSIEFVSKCGHIDTTSLIDSICDEELPFK